jgi:hypothetical protein
VESRVLSRRRDGGEQVSLIASAEPWDTVIALSPEGAAGPSTSGGRRLVAIAERPEDDAFAGELVLAADQFIIRRPAASRRPRAPAHRAMTCER